MPPALAAPDGPDPEDGGFVPSKEEVLAAREQALAGMAPEQTGRLRELVTGANQWWEWGYLYENIFGRLENPDDPAWNYFDQTGEIQIGWAWDGGLDKNTVCREEQLTEEAFYAQYGTRVVTENRYDAEDFIAWIDALRAQAQDKALRADLQYLMEETRLARETHKMEHANNLYKMLHDMDYFLLRYGPEDLGPYVREPAISSEYYGMLSLYEGREDA